MAWSNVHACCHLEPPIGVFTTKEKALEALKGAKSPGLIKVTVDKVYELEKLWPDEIKVSIKEALKNENQNNH